MKITDMPVYDDVSLQLAVDAETVLPSHINDLDFQHQFKSNRKLKWEVNPTVLEEKCIRILLEPGMFNYWMGIQRITSVVGTFMAYWCIRTWKAEMLWCLLLFPFVILALPHLLFIACMAIVIGVKLYYNPDIPLFWLLVFLTGLSFSITKTSELRASQAIIRYAFRDLETFWKYYSNQIVYPDWTADPQASKELLERYPELLLDEYKEPATEQEDGDAEEDQAQD